MPKFPAPIANLACLLIVLLASLRVAALKAADANPAKAPPAPLKTVIPRLKAAISIDGNLSEPVWKQAVLLQPFLKNDGTGPEREHTQVRLWYDDEALYLGWTCQDVDIQATFTNRDSKFWEEEVVEFFVTPGPLSNYFELQWNPLGGVFDAVISNKLDPNSGISKSFEGDWSFTASGMRSAVKLVGTPNNSKDIDEFWQVEVRLLFSDLKIPTPKAGDVWRGNFYRFNRTTGLPVEELSWSPTCLPGFHQPGRFGTLVFGK